MEIFLKYLAVFAVGGLLCMIGQILINRTKMTVARILVIFLLLGVFLEAATIWEPIKNFAGAGVTVPIVGFGAALAAGAIEGARQNIFQSFLGGLSAVSAGITAAIVFSFLWALIFNPRSKKL